MEKVDAALASESGENKKFWASLWRLKVPNKIKTFAWRACTDSLPTMENLVKRRVVQMPICSNCNKEPETVSHALWGCEKIRPAWGTLFTDLQAATTSS